MYYVNGWLKLTPHFAIYFERSILLYKKVDSALCILFFIEKNDFILEFTRAVFQVIDKSNFHFDLIALFNFSIDETIASAPDDLQSHLLRTKFDYVEVQDQIRQWRGIQSLIPLTYRFVHVDLIYRRISSLPELILNLQVIFICRLG